MSGNSFLAIATSLILEDPGKGSRFYAETALRRKLYESKSDDPVFSLASSLDKTVREGRLPGIRREKIQGEFRYFPVGRPLSDDETDALRIDLKLSHSASQAIRDLIEIGKFSSPSDAANWLIEQGVTARRQTLDKVALETAAIRRMRHSAQRLLDDVARKAANMTTTLTESRLDLPLLARGKVRDIYDLGDKLLIVATDRISAFDVVLPTPIPTKGAVLTQMSAFWFEQTGDIVPNHFIRVVDSTSVPEVPVELPREMIGRSMVVRKARRIDLECIVRGYITGSGWSDYKKGGSVSGIKLPEGLEESEELAEPVFTPTTKADEGHDMPITFKEVREQTGDQAANAMRVRSLALYKYGRDFARERGIIIADTKFEFGWLDDEVILIDEALTPDSSRFWPADQFQAGRAQPSFDKQFVRDYLNDLSWDKTPPGPELPDDVVDKTAEKYREAFERVTGRTLVLG